MVEKKIRVGVIGVGHLGQHHARIYSSLKETKLVGVVDSDAKRAEGVALRYNTQAYTDYTSLVNQVDAVSIVVPTSAHYDVAKDCLNWGLDVLVEKPFTVTAAQAEELNELAHKRGLLIQVGHSERFNAAVQALQKYIKNPRFIEVHRMGPFVARGLDVDVILDLMIHDLDIIGEIVPSPVRHIHASGVPVLSRNIDIASARLEFENGCVANITASRVSAEQLRKLRIFQDAQYLSVDYMKQELVSYDIVPEPDPVTAKRDFTLEKNQIEVVAQEPLRAELASFVESVKNRTKPVVSGEDGLRALNLALAVREKVQKNLQRQFPDMQ